MGGKAGKRKGTYVRRLVGLVVDVLNSQEMKNAGLVLSSTVRRGQKNKTLEQTEFISNT